MSPAAAETIEIVPCPPQIDEVPDVAGTAETVEQRRFLQTELDRHDLYGAVASGRLQATEGV